MANIRTLLDKVMECASEGNGSKVTVKVSDKNEYETIRTRLVTLWNEHKLAIFAIGGEDSDPLYPTSLCSNFHSGGTNGQGGCKGEFFLGYPRRKIAKSYSFEIVAPQEEGAIVPPTPTAGAMPAESVTKEN